MKFSIVLLNYNHSRFIKQSIESVLNQTFQDYELIIYDDASTDDSRDVIDLFLEHPKVRIIYSDVNRGCLVSANVAMRQCIGDYVWIRAADDWIKRTDYLDLVNTVANDYPQAGGVYSDCTVYHDDGNSRPDNAVIDKITYRSPEECRARINAGKLYVAGASIIMRRDIAMQYMHDETLGPFADVLLSYQCALNGGLIHIEHECVAVRRLANSFSNKISNDERVRLRELVRGRALA